jgi:hypothetical protein
MKTTTKTTYETELQTFTTILSGLLASGHYTEPPTDCEEGLIRVDLGKDWSEEFADDPAVQRRFVPNVLFAAELLWKDARHLVSETLEAEAK